MRVMRSPWHLAVAVLMLVSGVACNSPSSSSSLGTPAETVATLIASTNNERLRAGIAALARDSRLAQAAQWQAEQCARLGEVAHVLAQAMYPRPEDRLTAAGYSWSAYGENLARGHRTPEAAIDGWMRSAEHRANILDPAFTQIGTGFATDSSGRPYYVQVFGRP
jgi:uncharacterized protein YkwD